VVSGGLAFLPASLSLEIARDGFSDGRCRNARTFPNSSAVEDVSILLMPLNGKRSFLKIARKDLIKFTGQPVRNAKLFFF